LSGGILLLGIWRCRYWRVMLKFSIQHHNWLFARTSPWFEPRIRWRPWTYWDAPRTANASSCAEEEPEEIEGISEIDSEHRDPEPNPQDDDSSSGSALSVGNLDDF
jgi:hypothetical protein